MLSDEELAAEKAHASSMQTIEVSRRLAIWAIVGVCALSAAIGAGIALLAETGPGRPEGRARGRRGARPARAEGRSKRPTSAPSKPKSKNFREN